MFEVLLTTKMTFRNCLEFPKALLIIGSQTYGAKQIRTADPLNAIEVRYQLRYNPETLIQ